MEFVSASMTGLTGLLGIRIDSGSVGDTILKGKGNQARHRKLRGSHATGERCMIWLADDAVFDMYFFYNNDDAEMDDIIGQIRVSLKF